MAAATQDAANQLGFGAGAQSFEGNGSRLTQTESNGTTTYPWDVRSHSTALTAIFSCDGHGRRAQTTVNSTLTIFPH